MRSLTIAATALLALVLMGELGAIQAGAAGSQPATSVSASKEGLTLVMRLPGRLFPQGSTVPVTLQLHNGASNARVMWVWSCHVPPYGVQVLNRRGTVVYPPPTRSRNGLPCTGNMAPVLPPGKTNTYHLEVLLKGPLVRARIPFGVPASSGDTQEVISTRTVHVGNF